MMLALALAAVLLAIQFTTLVTWTRARPATPLVLAVLPAALLLIVLPAPLVGMQIISLFQGIAARGSGGVTDVARAFAPAAGPFRVGCIALAIVMIATLSWQHIRFLRHVADDQQAPDDGAASTGQIGWGGRLLLASILLVVPAGLLMWFVQDTMEFVMQVGGEASGPTARSLSQQELSGASARISNRLLGIVLVGFAMSSIFVLLGFANLVVSIRSKTRIPAGVSWCVAIIVAVLALVAALQWHTDIRGFEAVARR